MLTREFVFVWEITNLAIHELLLQVAFGVIMCMHNVDTILPRLYPQFKKKV